MIAAVKLRLLAEDIEAVVRRDRELGKRMKIPPTIPFDRAQWFITAVWAYLSGEAKTLDRAMGLSVGSGPPKIDRPDDEVYERSRRAWEMRIFENKSWKEVSWRTNFRNLMKTACVRALSVTALIFLQRFSRNMPRC